MQPKEYRNDDGDYFRNEISNVISTEVPLFIYFRFFADPSYEL